MSTIAINAATVLAYLASTLYLLYRYPKYLPLFGILSFMQLWSLGSCFYNDLGIYNVELFRYTETTFATTRLAAFYLVFNAGFAVAARIVEHLRFVRRDYSLSKLNLRLGGLKLLAYSGITLVALYIAYSLATNGIPAFSGIDRETYFRQANLVDRLLISWGQLIAFVLGMTARRGRRLSLNGAILLLLVIYALLVGHKFSLPSDLLIFYWAPIFARWVMKHPEWQPFKLKYFARAGMIVLLFLGVAYGTYAKRVQSIEGAGSLLVNRIMALQGELWWAVDNSVAANGGYDTGHWQPELNKILDPDHTSEESVGMRYLMIRILGGPRAYAIFEHGYLYTMAYPAILIVTFPYLVALLLQLLAGGILFVLFHYLHWSLVCRHHIRSIIAFLMVLPLMTTLVSGNFYVFFTFGMIVKAAVILAMESFPQPAQSDQETVPEAVLSSRS